MKLRVIALAGIAAMALSSPAFAGTGWYLGLAGGYSQLDENLAVNTGPAATPGAIHTSGGAAVAGAFGYKWDGGLRLENEIGYASHDVNQTGFGGTTSVTSDLVLCVSGR